MALILWILAVVLIAYGVVSIIRGEILLGVVLIIVGLLVGPGGVTVFGAVPAGAQTAPTGDLSPDTPSSAYFTINNTLVTIGIGFVLPLINGFLLRPTNPRWVKVLVAGVVAAGAQAISQAVQADGTAVISQEWLLGYAVTVAGMIIAYLGIWQPVLNPNAAIPTVAPAGDVIALASPRVRAQRKAAS